MKKLIMGLAALLTLGFAIAQQLPGGGQIMLPTPVVRFVGSVGVIGCSFVVDFSQSCNSQYIPVVLR